MTLFILEGRKVFVVDELPTFLYRILNITFIPPQREGPFRDHLR